MLTTIVMNLMMSAGLAGPCSSTHAAGPGSPPSGYAIRAVANHAEKDIVETALAAGTFNTLAAALEAADLVGTLKSAGPYTVFAPTDAAFAKLPDGTVEMLLKPENKARLTSILLYHVVPGEQTAEKVLGEKTLTTINGQRADIARKGGGAMIDGARITKTDIEASNGVIHVIDAVIMPETRAIPEVAESAGSFGTLLAAVKAAGLDKTLAGEGPFTVFAPTDEAFAALGSTVQDLLKPENREKLAGILTYHVIPGRVYADQAMKLKEAQTVNGKPVAIRSHDGRVRVGDATVVNADIEAANGVIHVIDRVLLP